MQTTEVELMQFSDLLKKRSGGTLADRIVSQARVRTKEGSPKQANKSKGAGRKSRLQKDQARLKKTGR